MLGRGGHNGAGGVLMASGLGLDTLCDTPPLPVIYLAGPCVLGEEGLQLFLPLAPHTWSIPTWIAISSPSPCQ